MPTIIDGDEYYSTDEACRYLDITRETLNRWGREGRIQKYKRGFSRTVYYRKSDLDALNAIRPADNGKDE